MPSRVLMAAALFVAYAGAFPPLYAAGVSAVAVLSLFPVGLAAWWFGRRGGVAAGIIGESLTAGLFTWVGYRITAMDVVVGGVGLVVVGAVIGHIRGIALALETRLGFQRTLLRTLSDMGEALVLARDDGATREVVEANDATRRLLGDGGRALTAIEGPGEFSVSRADGATAEIEVARGSFRAGAHDFIVTVARDISERRASHEALRRAEDRLRTMLAGSPAFVFSADLTGRITYASDNAAEVLGLRRADVDSWRDRIHPDDLVGQDPDQLLRDGRSCIEVRFRRADNTWMWVQSEQRLIRDAAGTPIEVIGYATDVSERRRARDDRESRLRHDELTGLPNRVSLIEHLDAVLGRADSPPIAVAIADVSDFRDVNEAFGRDFGDEVLRQLAERLRGVDPHAFVARLDGDKFAIAIAPTSTSDELGRRILQVFREPFGIDGYQVATEGRVGMAFSPTQADDARTLIRCAEVAMCEGARLREPVVLYAPERDGANRSRIALAADLRHAVVGGELLLHYQPIVDLATRSVSHVEALVRWRHPVRGLVPPAEFVPLAEQTGLMRPITYWVLEEAIRQSWAWSEQGLHLGVAVNISVRNLHDPELPLVIRRLLDRYGVDPSALTLEITESVVMKEPMRALETLGRLRSMGVRLSIDDFGTGYSSLAYLNRLPVDVIKIDRSFVRELARDESSAAIVRATIELSHTLGFAVVAEGVEDARSMEQLRGLHCDLIQGYLISRPIPAADLELWLAMDAHLIGLTAPSDAGSRRYGRKAVLVVDDQHVVRMTTQILLARNGFDVVTASSVAEALRAARNHRDIALAVVDVVLPDGDGVSLASELRALRPSTQIVLMSGHLASSLDLPADSPFLQKPFTEQALVASLGVHAATERAEVLARS